MSLWIQWPLAIASVPVAVWLAPRVNRWCYRQTLRLFGLKPEDVDK